MTIPDGYMQDTLGRLVPAEKVADVDKARDSLVREIADKAKGLQAAMQGFKKATMGDVGAFVALSAEKYGATIGGRKGNLTLMTYDGALKLQVQVQESLAFDERLQAAKTKIDECIQEWSQGANANIQALVNDAFQVDREGKLAVGRILSLRRLKIDDEKWRQAMQAISDAIQVVGSKAYVRLYEREGDGETYKPIVLDMAAL